MTRDQRTTARRIAKARAALDALTPTQRAALFREIGTCACSTLAEIAAKNPAVAAGAFLGGVFGALAGITNKKGRIGNGLPDMVEF